MGWEVQQVSIQCNRLHQFKRKMITSTLLKRARSIVGDMRNSEKRELKDSKDMILRKKRVRERMAGVSYTLKMN
jgi:hypothetical protein